MPRPLLLHEALDLMRKAGIPVAEYRVARSLEEALKAAEELGYPVALKVSSRKAIHKTEYGALVLGIKTPEELREKYRELMERMKKLGVDVECIVVQKMAPSGGAEAFLGGIRDPVFGPVVALGAGGILVELYRDVAFMVAPVSREEADEALSATKFDKVLRGFRGLGPYDREALIDMAVKLSRLMEEDEKIKEIDLNPVFVYPRGALAVDARVVYED